MNNNYDIPTPIVMLVIASIVSIVATVMISPELIALASGLASIGVIIFVFEEVLVK